jgi:hypothetical protein
MDIVYNVEQPTGHRMEANDIPIGTVFSCDLCKSTLGRNGTLFLRTHDGIVNLGDPLNTWRDDITVNNYRPRCVHIVVDD